jgi:hypothetical protein
MPDYDSPLARVFAVVGGAAIAVSTLIAWFDFQVILNLGPIAPLLEIPVNLWNHDALAASLLLAAGLAAMALLSVPPAYASRWPAILSGLLGLGVTVYALIQCFNPPDLGIRAQPQAGVHAQTFVDGGALLAVVGGVMVFIGSVIVFVVAHRTATAGERTARRGVHPPPAGAAPA